VSVRHKPTDCRIAIVGRLFPTVSDSAAIALSGEQAEAAPNGLKAVFVPGDWKTAMDDLTTTFLVVVPSQKRGNGRAAGHGQPIPPKFRFSSAKTLPNSAQVVDYQYGATAATATIGRRRLFPTERIIASLPVHVWERWP
jgi:hypothetical protein